MIADIADGKGLAEEIAAAHGANSVTSIVADVSDETAVERLVAATVERFGKIDVLVNNAALFAPLQETKCTEIDSALPRIRPSNTSKRRTEPSSSISAETHKQRRSHSGKSEQTSAASAAGNIGSARSGK